MKEANKSMLNIIGQIPIYHINTQKRKKKKKMKKKHYSLSRPAVILFQFYYFQGLGVISKEFDYVG